MALCRYTPTIFSGGLAWGRKTTTQGASKVISTAYTPVVVREVNEDGGTNNFQ